LKLKKKNRWRFPPKIGNIERKDLWAWWQVNRNYTNWITEKKKGWKQTNKNRAMKTTRKYQLTQYVDSWKKERSGQEKKILK
jgi:phage anti-repressor protein